MTLVSVVIPCYNVEKYLRQCLDSVLNQTLKDIEIICVNDGSTDSTLSILKEYESKDNRITVVDKQNGGLSSARNKGLEFVNSELVYFLDSDDFIEATLLEYAINIFNNFDIDYFCFGSKAFCEDSCIQSLEDMNNYLKVKRDGLFDLNFDIGFNTNIHVWNKIFKTSIIKRYNIRFVDKLLYEDIYFMWYYFFVSNRAYFDNSVFHYYRMRSSSIMEKATSNKTLKTGLDHLYNYYELYTTLANYKEIFLKNFESLLFLLNSYVCRTKEMLPPCDKYNAELLKIKYQNELNTIKDKFIEEDKFSSSLKYSFLENIFSVKNSKNKKHKIINCFGIKIKLRKNYTLPKMLVHLHVYYHEQIDFYLERLKNITNCSWDLYVTVVEDNHETINKILKLKPTAKILLVKNIGYDIYPFIHVLRQIDLNQYDYIMKLHTKNYQDKEPFWHGEGWTWRNLLINSMLASKNQFKTCLNILNNPKIGEIGAKNTLVYMGDKAPEDTYLYDEYCEKFKISNIRGHFIAGSMFIVKSQAMFMMKNLPCNEDDFKISMHTGDKATLAHVIERFLGVLVEKQGYLIVGV